MKQKTYVKPQMEAVEIKMQGMIAASDPGYGGGGGGGGNAPIMPDFDEDMSDFYQELENVKLW